MRSIRNENLEVLVLEERGTPQYPEQTSEPTANSTHIWKKNALRTAPIQVAPDNDKDNDNDNDDNDVDHDVDHADDNEVNVDVNDNVNGDDDDDVNVNSHDR